MNKKNELLQGKISRKEFAKQITKGVGSAAFFSSLPTRLLANIPQGSVDKPNIVFVCSDQHSHKYTGYSGHDLVRTPNLDRIAQQGITFNNAYCGSPVCTPGRACMMTGVFPSDTNSFGNSTVWDGSYPTWGTRLQEAGYDTWGTGKMDLDAELDIGFEQVETSHGHCRNPDITELFRSPVGYRMGERPMVTGKARDHRHEGDSSRRDHALRYMRNKAEKAESPWAAYIGFYEPHPPFAAWNKHFNWYYPGRVDMPNIPPSHLGGLHLMFQELRRFKRVATPIAEEHIRRARAGYFGLITELDKYIGQLWDQLERTGQLDNTIFIYTSDHGEMLGDHGLWYKNNLYEGAAHIPLIMAGGGVPNGKQIETPVSHVDLIYTLLEWAGAERPDSLRGYSLSSMINGHGLGDHPGYAYSESHSEGNCTGSFMIRKGNWKYIHFTWYDDLLFNLSGDPGEFINRINDPAAKSKLNELKDILHTLVEPGEVTERAFQTQNEFLYNMIQWNSRDQLFDILKGRLGIGHAKALINRLA